MYIYISPNIFAWLSWSDFYSRVSVCLGDAKDKLLELKIKIPHSHMNELRIHLKRESERFQFHSHLEFLPRRSILWRLILIRTVLNTFLNPEMKAFLVLLFLGVSYGAPSESDEYFDTHVSWKTSGFGDDSSSFESFQVALASGDDWRCARHIDKVNTHVYIWN